MRMSLDTKREIGAPAKATESSAEPGGGNGVLVAGFRCRPRSGRTPGRVPLAGAQG